MRTTVDLPDDLHRVIVSLARHTRRSLSATAVDLMRRGLVQVPERGALLRRSPVTGLPVVDLGRTVTADDVKSLEDEA